MMTTPMTAQKKPEKWANLPKVRGTYAFGHSLREHTTFCIGGKAEVVFFPQDLDDLATFWANRPQNTPITLLGGGSNILIRDGGIAGVVVYIAEGCDAVKTDGLEMYAEAGASTGKVARAARAAELTGLEFLCGIPGSMGGALVMNAGCYGDELCDSLTAVDVIDDSGQRKTLPPVFFRFGYRQSTLPEGWIFTGAHMRLEKGEKTAIRDRMREINKKRADSQPLKWPNAGSLFKNPAGHKAWELIDIAGCRGMRKGDAQVSEKHSNFFINLGSASAAEMEDLAEEVRKKVKEASGITLEWEVRLLGDRAPRF